MKTKKKIRKEKRKRTFETLPLFSFRSLLLIIPTIIDNKVISLGFRCSSRTLFKVIVYYVSRRIMRVITRRATMLAGDRSQGVVEAQLRQSRDEAKARSVLRAFYTYTRMTFREYFRPFLFPRSCVVVAYCIRRMLSSNAHGFFSTLPTLYEEEEEE